MVALEFARGRAVAVAIAALMFVTILPAPLAQAQVTVTADVSLEQGSAQIFQQAFDQGRTPTQFITNDNQFTRVRVPVSQTGGAPLTNVPVYWFFYGTVGGPDVPDKRGCTLVSSIPGASAQGATNSTNVSFDIRTDDLPVGGYRLSIWALRNPFDGGSTPPGCGDPNNYRRPCNETTSADSPLPRSGCVTEPDVADADGGNNHVTAYFVKHAYVDPHIEDVLWCVGPPETSAGDPNGCIADMIVDDAPYNVTVQDQDRETFFQALVKNVGNWTDLANYGGPTNTSADSWEYDLNVTLTGNFTPKTYLSARRSFGYNALGDDSHRAHSTEWDIRDLAGRYNVTVKVDAAKELRYPTASTASHLASRDADVMYRDFTGNITWAGQGATAANPYPYDGPFTINGGFTFTNIGTANGIPNTDVDYVIYIDNLTDTTFLAEGELTITDAGESVFVPFSFDVSSSTSSTQYIPPGKHKVVAYLDPENDTLELNESNNNVSIDIYLADETVPTFKDDPKITSALPGAINLPTRSEFYPHEAFSVFANATDDDAGLTVVANFTLDSDPTVYRKYNMARPAGATWFALRVQDFDFHNFTNRSADGTEMWTLTVRANDSSDNNASGKQLKVKLKPWPIHTVPAESIIIVPDDWPNETVVPWEGDDVQPEWKIRVLPNQTGFNGEPADPDSCPCQQNYTENLAYNVTTAKGRTFDVNGSAWEAQTPWEPGVCRRAPANDFDPTDLVEADTCPADLNNTFSAGFSKTQEGAGPGHWNYSIRISDRAGHARVINGTIFIEDKAPQFHDSNISVTQLAPGENFTVKADVTDDDNTITAAHVHFARAQPGDGAVVNLTLTDFEEDGDHYLFNQTFKVGRNEIFGLGGTFNVNVSVSDLTGNWNHSSLGQFVVADEDAPTLTSYGVHPNVAEIGENVTFYAKVTDTTNVTVKLELFRTTTSSELLMDAITLTEGLDGNFTASLNLTGEGVHAWRLTPVDSVGRPAATLGEGTLTIRDNLGPRYEVRSPSAVIDGERYGSGRPRIDLVVYDLEGVLASSLDMRVAGLPVDHSIAPAPGNLNGFLVSYQVPPNKKFNHNDVVEVNLTSQDNSSEHLQSWLNFTFKVDDVAPVAKIVSISPSYRDQAAHVLNVSLNSRFTLGGDDNDGLPTDVESIRYKIVTPGPSAETVYTGPFKIGDAPGVYTGPRLYQIQYWAEDAVGNVNPTFNVTTVYVDDTPPALFQFFPQGREINATFVDDRVGVNRSVVWYRENAEPYVPLPLVEKDGSWSLSLPEGVKGDKVSYYLQAWDRLDNTETFGNATSPYASFSVDNHEPKVRITNPVDGSRIFRTVDLTWDASDEDGDALVFTVYYRAPGKTNFVELAKIENSAARRYTLDSARFPDGQYTFRVAAGDGGFVKLSETTVTILNRASAVGVVNVQGSGVPGETMLIKAEITKAEAIVEARLFLDGDLVESYPMNDEGKDGDEVPADGIYSVRVPISVAGDYSVEIFTQYREDGELKESSVTDAATFSAKLTPGYLLTQYGAIIAVIGLLAAVGIGVAVFVVMRRR